MMRGSVAEVLANEARWAAVQGGWETFLPSLPDDSIDLLITSPPYMKARTYGIDFAKDAEEWTAWMVEFVRAAAPKVRGLIAINCEGQTLDYRYHPAPMMLAADLHRAGFNLRKPPAYRRYGIPGSGGPDWLRNDWEPVVVVTRGGKLLWSDNTACGRPPRWDKGGEPTYRRPDGTRANSKREKVKELVATGVSQRAAARKVGLKMTGATSGLNESGTVNPAAYVPPDIANPGNVIDCKVGGDNMGHPLAHESEAPFPVELPAFFIKSFCPPDGIVLDPFVGSGTTIQAALENGRRAIGCDIRQSQIDLTARRLATVTASLPGL